MIVKIVRTGLRPVRENMILWATDRLREVDRGIYAVNCRIMDLELEVRGRFTEFDRDLNRDIPDHILIDRLYKMMSWSDQKTVDRRRREGGYYDYGDYDDDYYYNDSKNISREISRGISRGIEDAFSILGERVDAFVKEQENSAPTPVPTAPPVAAPAATQQDVVALQQQLAALQAQLAALQTPAAPPATDTTSAKK